MSLIERAVSKLRPKAGAAPQPESLDPLPPQPMRDEPGHTPPDTLTRPPFEDSMPFAATGTGEFAESAEQADWQLVAAPDTPLAFRGPRIDLRLDLLREKGFAVPDGKQSQVAHRFRLIKRPLLSNITGRLAPKLDKARRIMVTSSRPGEGKTYCAINLAMSLAAERDSSVLLIDADVVRPAVPKTLGFTAERGLIDWLLGDVESIHDLVISTNIRRLSILPAGRRHELATELLSSGSMARVLDGLTAAYPNRIFVFDAPPLLAAAEAQALASHMGQVILVVEAGVTPRSVVDDSLAMLKSAPMLGVVLNKARESGGPGSYGYEKGVYGER